MTVWVEVRDRDDPAWLYGVAVLDSENGMTLARVRRVGPAIGGGLDAREWSCYQATGEAAWPRDRFRPIGRRESACFEWA